MADEVNCKFFKKLLSHSGWSDWRGNGGNHGLRRSQVGGIGATGRASGRSDR